MVDFANFTDVIGSKSERTKLRILDATIEIVSRRGFEGLSLSQIAKKAKIDRSLPIHHFGTLDKIVEKAIDLSLFYGATYTEEALSKKSGEDPLLDYIEVSFQLLEDLSVNTAFVTLLIQKSQYDRKIRRRMQPFFKMAQSRIKKMLKRGQQTQKYRKDLELVQMSKVLHSFIIGVLISAQAQDNPRAMQETALKGVKAMIL